MTDDFVKSPMQLKYELDNINLELVSLLKNWKKKKNDSLAQLIGYRAELKELKAVLAATEEGNKAYLELVQLISNLTSPPTNNPNNITNFRHDVLPDSVSVEPDYLREIKELINVAQAKEAARISQAREIFKTQSDHVLRKTKQIYMAMEEEKRQVEAYAETLTNKCRATEAQLQAQLKTSGMGIGL